MNSNNIEILSKSQLFKNINLETIGKLLQRCHCQYRVYVKNELLVVAGEEVKSIMLLMVGKLRTEVTNGTGRVIRIADLSAGQIISPAFIFGNVNLFPVNVVADSEVKILIIEKSTFLEMILMEKQLVLNFLNIISNKTQFLSNRIKEILLPSIKIKIANYLISLYHERNSMHLKIEHSQAWLAERFAVTRPSVARVFAEMKAEMIINIKGRNLDILNMDALTKLTIIE